MAEISNLEEFEIWLEDRPDEWAQVIAVRVVLRVLPLVSSVFGEDKLSSYVKRGLVFSVFLATATSWVGRKYPTQDMVSAAGAARQSATSFAAASAPASHSFVASAAAFAASAASTSDAFATSAAARAASDASASTTTAAISADIWASINPDVLFLQECCEEPQSAAQSLAGKGLWLTEKGEISTPKWILTATEDLERCLLALNDDWHVWSEWYRPLLQGHSGWGLSNKYAEELIVRITTQEEEFWEEGVSVVNTEIADWLEEFRDE